MRLRFTVKPEGPGTNESYRVRLELINVTDQPIPLAADWEDDSQKGDFKEWLAAETSIETQPEIIGPMVQRLVSTRTLPQPEYSLAPRETLAVEWISNGRKLKNSFSHFFDNHNPVFPTDGLYSIHVSLALCSASNEAARAKTRPTRTPDGRGLMAAPGQPLPDAISEARPHGDILLRSNEELLPVGGSRELPKHTLGKVTWVDTNRNTAIIDLGARQKVEVGDRFRVYSSRIGYYWDLKITKLNPTTAQGDLRPFTAKGENPNPVSQPRLEPGQICELIPPTDPRFKTLPESTPRE